MNIIAVDDEKSDLDALVCSIEKAIPDARTFEFQKPEEALFCIREKNFDVAFIGINMHSMTGLQLAGKMKDIRGDLNIIFTMSYSEYSLETFHFYSWDYLLKPATPDAVRRAIEHLRDPVKPAYTKRVRFRCFGNFEVFADDKPIAFREEKSKEVLAYLVDRAGAFVTSGELMTAVLEDSHDALPRKICLRDLIADIKNVLSEYGAKNIIIKNRSGIAIDCKAVDCDYYDFLRNVPYAVNSYHGKYMMQYSWAELKTSSITRLS